MKNATAQSTKVSVSAKQANNQVQDHAEKTPDLGLCITCDNSASCVFPRTNIVVLNCDELDYPPSGPSCEPDEKKLRLGVVLSRESVMETASEDEGHLGLCSTCEIRSKCVFPKSESGIWNCDEFV